ncbi:MAG: MoxR family ATPase [Bdellovibrionales bacterium]|nr:MoxR family ATPase [Bdellovibrionales bacterium]
MTNLSTAIQELKTSIEKTIFGKKDVIDLLLTCMLAEGHTLIEDVPGVGKTTLASSLAKSIDGSFQRIQFTSDLLPSDMIGVPIYNENQRSFEFHPGPIFANIVLADEINRTTPKTQSALLEAMQDGQVTVDRTTHELPRPFMVIATQNPIEFRGTYALPESQMDRFMMKLHMGYPEPDQELRVLKMRTLGENHNDIKPILDAKKILTMQEQVKLIRVEESVARYMLNIISSTRNSRTIDLGVSPRGSVALYRASQAYAFVQGRSYVTPDDVKKLCVPVLSHRILINRQRDLKDGVNGYTFQTEEDLLFDVVNQIDIPV